LFGHLEFIVQVRGALFQASAAV